MKTAGLRLSAAMKKIVPAALALIVAVFFAALIVRWGVMLMGPTVISHNNPAVMALAFTTLYVGTGAYILRQQFIQMAGIIRALAITEINLPLPQILRVRLKPR
jgi:hypothetical protein